MNSFGLVVGAAATALSVSGGPATYSISVNSSISLAPMVRDSRDVKQLASADSMKVVRVADAVNIAEKPSRQAFIERLKERRARAIAGGMKMMSLDEIRAEVVSRRGELG